MAEELISYDHQTDEEYIDMEVSSNSSNFFSHHPMSSPPGAREFEFQKFSSSSAERKTTTSPADELFYKGKLLPLHLPPRLQMVEKLLLQNSNSYNNNIHTTSTTTDDSFEEEYFTTTPLTTTYTTPSANTPYESCNISPSESFHMIMSSQQELNPNHEYFSTDQKSSSINDQVPKKSWPTRKLKLIKQSLRSFFTKSSCSEEGSTFPRGAKEYRKIQSKGTRSERKTPLGGQMEKERYHQYHSSSSTVTAVSIRSSFNKEKNIIAPAADHGGGGVRHRRSFSGAIKRLSATNINNKCSSYYSSSSSSTSSSSSSSSLGNSNGSHESRFLRRSSSVSTSDMENSIQGAIAHCKRSSSQEDQVLHSRKTVSELPFYSLSASRFVYDG